MTDALRGTVLLVPITDDDHILLASVQGIDWICAFTDEVQYARYLAARSEFVDSRYQGVLGSRLFDTLLATLSRPTGVLVDIAGETPLVFPPEASSMESAR